jgi:hypothetical protein
MIVKLRKFNEAGVARFKEIILGLSPNLLSEIRELLSNEDLSSIVGGEIEIKPIRSRLMFAEHLWNTFQSLDNQGISTHFKNDKFFWDWMAAAWLEALVDADPRTDIVDKIGTAKDAPRWILIEDKTRFHRHLVSGPFFAYEANFPKIQEAMVLFAGDVLKSGELWERIAGKTSLATGQVVHLATLMFFDPATNSIRTGAGSKDVAQAFSKYFSEIDLTLDYEGDTVENLQKGLPSSFEKWSKFASAQLQLKNTGLVRND